MFLYGCAMININWYDTFTCMINAATYSSFSVRAFNFPDYHESPVMLSFYWSAHLQKATPKVQHSAKQRMYLKRPRDSSMPDCWLWRSSLSCTTVWVVGVVVFLYSLCLFIEHWRIWRNLLVSKTPIETGRCTARSGLASLPLWWSVSPNPKLWK